MIFADRTQSCSQFALTRLTADQVKKTVTYLLKHISLTLEVSITILTYIGLWFHTILYSHRGSLALAASTMSWLASFRSIPMPLCMYVLAPGIGALLVYDLMATNSCHSDTLTTDVWHFIFPWQSYCVIIWPMCVYMVVTRWPTASFKV